MDLYHQFDPQGRSDAARRLRVSARTIARSRHPVLVTGEIGTGKLRFARLLHELSERPALPFRRINCADEAQAMATINEGPIGGTLVFEHIDEASLILQKCAARAVAHFTFQRSSLRIVATSRRDLAVEVLEARFLSDLYFRLRVHNIDIPPIRDRREDVAVLIRSILEELAKTRGGEAAELTSDAVILAEQYHWPGNIRQLQNELLRCAAKGNLTIGSALLAEGLDDRIPAMPIRAEIPSRGLQDRVLAFEKQIIQETLATTLGNRDRAAGLLGITRRTLQRKMAILRTIGSPVEIPLLRMRRTKPAAASTAPPPRANALQLDSVRRGLGFQTAQQFVAEGEL
ncbi:MAG: sigma-54-dependent transcriptional regulator [Planctomycetota bacterium]